MDCANGNILAQEQTTATSKEKVLDALGSEVTKLRGELGESLASLQKSDLPLEQLTTPSLEALQALHFGRQGTGRGQGRLGGFILLSACKIELDPNFAHALFFGRNNVPRTRGLPLREKEYITKGLMLCASAPAPTKACSCRRDYYDYVLGDLDKSSRAVLSANDRRASPPPARCYSLGVTWPLLTRISVNLRKPWRPPSNSFGCGPRVAFIIPLARGR